MKKKKYVLFKNNDDIHKVTFLHKPAIKSNNKAKAVLKYKGQFINRDAKGAAKHFFGINSKMSNNKIKLWTKLNPNNSQWKHGMNDKKVMELIDSALYWKIKKSNKPLKFKQIQKFEYDTRKLIRFPKSDGTYIYHVIDQGIEVGYAKGKCSHTIRIHVDTKGVIHAHPVVDRIIRPVN